MSYKHETITYLELPANDIEAVKSFFTQVFAWKFLDFGSDYAAYTGSGMEGGFYKSELSAKSEKGSVLPVFYSARLEETQAKIESAGGTVVKETYSFPGGRRFHFADPNGNEFGVWSEPAE